MPKSAALLILVLCGACSDNTLDPCSPAHACEYRGEHLAIESISFTITGIDPQTRLPLASAADGIPVHLEIRNRGDTMSAPARVALWVQHLWFEDTIPGLKPGQLLKKTAVVPFRGPVVLADSDVISVDVAVWRSRPDGEWIYLAQERSTPVHVLVPAVKIVITAPADTIVFGARAHVTVSVTNNSHTALAPMPIFLGLWNWPHVDVPFPAWPPLDMPAIAAGTTYAFDGLVPVAPHAGYLTGGGTYALYACVKLDTLGAVMHTGIYRSPCGRDYGLYGVPDLLQCATAIAVPGQVVDAGRDCDGTSPRWAFWALNVQAHRRYRFLKPDGTKQDGVLIRARDGTGIAGSNVFGVNDWEAPLTGQVYLALQFPPASPKLLVQELVP